MPLKSLTRHREALESSSWLIKSFVGQDAQLCTAQMVSFQHQWATARQPPFDLYAFAPVLDFSVSRIQELARQYDLDGAELYGFVMSDEDADEATALFEFLTFLYANCFNKPTASELFSYLETHHHLFCLAANPRLATAAALFWCRFGDHLLWEREDFYGAIATVLARDDYIPIYGPEYRGYSDYACYLDEAAEADPEPHEKTNKESRKVKKMRRIHRGDKTTKNPQNTEVSRGPEYTSNASRIPNTSKPGQQEKLLGLSVGAFNPSPEHIEALSQLELIRQGTAVLPRSMWNDLIYECRKLPPKSLAERVDLVNLHVAHSLLHEQSVPITHNISKMQRYQDVLDPQLLKEFPQFMNAATSLMYRYFGRDCLDLFKFTTSKNIQNSDLVLFALQQEDPQLLNAITAFYTKWPHKISHGSMVVTPCIFSVSSSMLVLRQLEDLCRNESNLELQQAILLGMKCAINIGNLEFIGDSSYASAVQQFISLLRAKIPLINPDALLGFLETEIAKGLLFVICALIERQPDVAVTISSDNITLKSLAAATNIEALRVNAIEALCSILSVDMICFTHLDTILWRHFMAVNDPLAVACLYSCLGNSTRGCALIEEFEYTKRLFESITSHLLSGVEYSEYYYTVLTTALTRSLTTLREFSQRVPEYLNSILQALAEHDERYYDLCGRVFRRSCRNAGIVNRCIWLMASLAHYEPVRLSLLSSINMLLRAIGHKNLPFEYAMAVTENSYLHMLWNKMAGGRFLPFVIFVLLECLDKALARGDLRASAAIIACLSPFSFDHVPAPFIASICSNKPLERICIRLPSLLLGLAHQQAHFLSGPDAHMVECFWSGPGDSSVRQGPGLANIGPMQLAELKAFDNLGADMESYEKVRGKANLVRLCSYAIRNFGLNLRTFLNVAERCEVTGAAALAEIYVTRIIKVISSARFETVQQRFAFFAYSYCFRFGLESKFVALGGFKASINAFIKLQRAKSARRGSNEPKSPEHQLLKRYSYRDSDYFPDCVSFVNALVKLAVHYACEESRDHSKQAGCPNGPGACMDAIGHYLKNLRTSSFPFIPSLINYHSDKTHDLSEWLWIQTLVVKDYRSILENLMMKPSQKDVIPCARVIASVLVSLNRHRPVIGQLAFDLSTRTDAASIALLGALIEMAKVQTVPSSATLSSSDPVLLACTANILRQTPSIAVHQNLDVTISACEEPHTILMLLELYTSRVLVGEIAITGMTLLPLLDHCLSVFESHHFDHTCLLGVVSLIDLIHAVLEVDPEVLSMVMADLVLMQQENSVVLTCGVVETQFGKLADRGNAFLQSALEKYCILDPPTQEIYPRRYIAELGLASPIKMVPLHATTKHICDLMLERYTEASNEFLSSGKEFYHAEQAFKKLRRSKSSVELSSKITRLDELESTYAATLERFRTIYLKIRVFSDALTHLSARYNSAAEYIITNDRFTGFIGAAIRCACIIGLFRLNPLDCQWSSHFNWEHYRNYVFWPVVNLLNHSYKDCKSKLLNAFEAILEIDSSRETTFGVLYIMQVQGLHNEHFLEHMEQTRILQLCEQCVDFKSAPLSMGNYNVEAAMLYLASKLSSLHEYIQSTSLALGIQIYPDDEDDERSEILTGQLSELNLEDTERDYYHTAEESEQVDSQSEQVQPEGEDSEEASSFGNVESPNEEGEEEEIASYSDNNVQDTLETASSPFDIGSYSTTCPRPHHLYRVWQFEGTSLIPFHVTSTLADVVQDSEEVPDTVPIYAWEQSSSSELLLRGLDLCPYTRPEDPDSTCSAGQPRIKYLAIQDWPTFVEETGGAKRAPKIVFNILTRTWDCFSKRPYIIDWSKLEILDRSKLDTDSREIWGEPVEEPLSTAEEPSTTEAATCGILTGPEPSDEGSSNFAVMKAIELLEAPALASSWGIDPESIAALPEELRLEVLVSRLLNTGGAEMTTNDILATLDDSQFIKVCDDACGEPWVPKYFKLCTRAQMSNEESVSMSLDRLYYVKINKQLKLQWSEESHLNLGYFCARTMARYPSHVSNMRNDEVLLDFFLHNITSLSPRSVSELIAYFSILPNGSFDAIKLLDIIDLPVVTRLDGCLYSLIDILKKFIAVYHAQPIANEVLTRIINAFYARTLTPDSRKQCVDLLQLLVSNGLCSTISLSEIVCQDLLEQIDKCLYTRNGIVDLQAFSDLEATLSTLTSYKICDLDTESSQLITKSMELGINLSLYIKEQKSCRLELLKCYLSLASIVKSTRAAFIGFVEENKPLINQLIAKDRTLMRKCLANLRGYYDLLTFKVRAQVVRQNYKNKGVEAQTFVLRREHIVEDTLASFEGKSLQEDIRISFQGEIAFDDGGPTREWLTLLGRKLPESPLCLFKKVKVGNHFSVHPTPLTAYGPTGLKPYETIGKVMARAITSQQPFDCRFSTVVLKALTGSRGDLELSDVESFDPQLAQGLKWILQNDITNVIYDTFTTRMLDSDQSQTVELMPGGANITVSEENKRQYVDLVVQSLYRRVSDQIEALCRGFYSVLPLQLAQIFSPQEIELLMCGSSEVDVGEWKSNTSYRDYTLRSVPVQYFWQAMSSVSNEDRKKVLMFVTGSNSVSALGFSLDSSDGTKFMIAKETTGDLPRASTCISTLFLPEYSTYEELRTKLMMAIELAGEGFGLA